MIRTRFAPSPNGSLHLGHALSAIVAHDVARERGGRFLLRIEDIDGARSRPELAQEFRDDLKWLGLSWDEEALQSQRLTRYDEVATRLRELGLLYPCTCTRAEITSAAVRLGPDGPVYPGTCRGRQIDPNLPAAWRLDCAQAMALTGPLTWLDELRGEQRAQPELFGDVVLVRKDEPGSYHLAVTVDDAADGISVVTRGMDLFASTHIHRLLQTVLGLEVPVWHHHALLLDETGKKLAKSRGSPSLADRRHGGEDGQALARALRQHLFPAGITLGGGLDNLP